MPYIRDFPKDNCSKIISEEKSTMCQRLISTKLLPLHILLPSPPEQQPDLRLPSKLKNQSQVSGPMIWSHDTCQWVACFDSCQLPMTWIPKIKDVATVFGTTLLLNSSRYWDTNILVWTVQSHENQNILDQWVTKFIKGLGLHSNTYTCTFGVLELRYKADTNSFCNYC